MFSIDRTIVVSFVLLVFYLHEYVFIQIHAHTVPYDSCSFINKSFFQIKSIKIHYLKWIYNYIWNSNLNRILIGKYSDINAVLVGCVEVFLCNHSMAPTTVPRQFFATKFTVLTLTLTHFAYAITYLVLLMLFYAEPKDNYNSRYDEYVSLSNLDSKAST